MVATIELGRWSGNRVTRIKINDGIANENRSRALSSFCSPRRAASHHCRGQGCWGTASGFAPIARTTPAAGRFRVAVRARTGESASSHEHGTGHACGRDSKLPHPTELELASCRLGLQHRDLWARSETHLYTSAVCSAATPNSE